MTFVFVSGRPSLDLLGTLKWRRSDATDEQLTDAGRVREWAVAAGLVDALPVVDTDLAATLRLREAMYRIVTARLSGAALRPADVAVLNAHARREPVVARLRADGRVRRRASTDQLLAALARDLLDLLAGEELGRVRECSSPDCTRLYVDNSRSGNRRWCGMAECGNRAKVAAFRQRHRSAEKVGRAR
jgi:predicted RNA-binding Zn ribbon-like protein